MAAALHAYNPPETYATAAPSWHKPSARGPIPVNQGKRQAVEIGGFTKIPRTFFGSGMAARLGRSASLLYIALCEYTNRNSSLSFKTSDKALASETTIAPRTIIDARKKLIESGLISCQREKGQSYVYTLKALTLAWKPLKERLRQPQKPRAYHAARKAQV
jgi:hypothetical protein